MAKTTEVISDFSGGIVKGYAEENLKNNQLTDCNNLIADGVGKINTIPNTLSQSASDFNVNLPSAKGKNIHVISSDVNLQNANSQTSNVTAGVSITELDKAYRARLFLYISPLELSSDDIHIKIDDVVRNETLIDWHLDGSIFSTNDSLDNEEQKTYGAVHQIELNAHSDNQNNDLSYKDVINWKWLKTNEVSFIHSNETAQIVSWGANDTLLQGTTTGNRYNGDGYIYNITGTDFGNADFYRVIAEFDHYGSLQFQLDETVSRALGTSSNSSNAFIEWNDTDNPAVKYEHFNNEFENQDPDNQTSFTTLTYNNVDKDVENNKYFGQYSKWEYKLPAIPINKAQDYTLEVVFYADVDQSTTQSISVTYSQELGQNAYDVRTGLFSLLQTKIENEYPDYEIAWSDNGEAVVFRQYENTNKAYGISAVNSTEANAVTTDIEDIPAGLAYQNLVAIALENAQIAVYNVQDDKWNDWALDLRENTSISYKTMLAFADAEGYLKICDAEFRDNNKAKWFGYLNLNKTYINKEFNSGDGAFYSDHFSPSPYHTSSSHTVHYANEYFEYDNSNENDMPLDIPNQGTNTPNNSGLKLYNNFIDGTHTNYDILEGIFTQKDIVKYYFVYTYEGGCYK